MRVITVKGSEDSAVVCSEDQEELVKAISYITGVSPPNISMDFAKQTFSALDGDGNAKPGSYHIYTRVAHISG